MSEGAGPPALPAALGSPDEEEIDLDDGLTPFETVDADLFELVRLRTSPRGARVPPPPAKEAIDLDALVRDAASAPLLPPVDLPPVAQPSDAGSRSTWSTALLVAITAIVAGAASALTMSLLTVAPSDTPAPPEPATFDRTLVAATVESGPSAPSQRPTSTVRAPVESQPSSTEAVLPSPAETTPAPTTSSRHPQAHRPTKARRQPRPRPAARAPAETETALPPTEPETLTRAEAALPADEPPGGSLPEHPSRADVDAAVRAILPALRTCGQGVDVVTLELHFASNGRATTGQVEARHLSPTQRSCIARAARTARVPPFSAAHLSVRYPVHL